MELQAYTDTKLIECNRRSSVEYKGGNYGNNAIFTNKLDAGISLKVGDTVSMETAIVSDLGAGNDTIEFKGESLKKIKTFKYSNVRTALHFTDGIKTSLSGFSAQIIEPAEKSVELKDNEATISVSYYKTANGEGCFGLPRRFGYNSALTGKNLFISNDTTTNGATRYQIHKGTFVDEDYYRDRNASAIFNDDPFLNRELYKIRQDGTKYTIFARKYTYNNTNASSEEFPLVEPTKNRNGSYDPALDEYNKYIELKTISIPKGRRSADFIAEKITRTLQNASELKTFNRATNNNLDIDFPYENQGILTATLKSETFKPFNCHGYGTFNKTLFDQFNSTQFNIGTLKYLSGLQYISFKRPEFVEAGRNTRSPKEPNKHIVEDMSDNASSGRLNTSITLSLTYTKDNLDKLSAFLKSQELFPEFWDIVKHPDSPYYSQILDDVAITINNSRFFHMDQQNRFQSGKIHGRLHAEFGSDMYGDTSYENIASQPLFIYYDKSQEDKYYDSPFFTNASENQLTYGCFSKDEEFNKIVIHPNGLSCGIPAEYYNDDGYFVGDSANPSYLNTLECVYVGYDYHFTAYGNAAMGLWGDYINSNFSDNTEIGLRTINASGVVINTQTMEDIINQLYIGAPDPKLSYDSTKDRFGWEGFYTPEFEGNIEGAGEDTINKIEDGSAQCYKINKRLKRNAYTPGMNPNQAQDNASYTTSTNGSSEKAWELANKCIYPFSIIDSQSGIRIENFGYDESEWDQGLFSILGFSYNQLQAPLTALNSRSARISDANLDSLNTLTTQADVKPGDVLTYTQNIFQANTYQSRIQCAQIFKAISPTRDIPFLTPIILPTSSNIITAESVPKQMLKPMYIIRSDVLEDSQAYLGSEDSGQPLSNIGYVMKNYNAGDYFYGQESSVTFTITRPKILTHITTAICDPDGTYSNVDDSSVVIYKIQNNRELPGNIIGQILKK